MTYPNGIDVSYANGLASTKGQSFAFVRACYGTTRDWKYLPHVANFKLRGLPVIGAYAFGVNFQDPVAQARSFLSIAKGAAMLALDLESDGPHRPRMTNAQAALFIATVHKAGRKIGLYHSRSGFPLSLGQDWNWVADYDNTRAPNIPWKFWQHQGSPLDRNYFNGTEAQLLVFAGKALVVPAPPAPVQTGNPYPPGSFESVDWYHAHGFNQVGGVWVIGGTPVPPPAPVPPPIVPPPAPQTAPPIPLTPTMVEAMVRPYAGTVPTQVALGPCPAFRFGSAGPIFVLVHGGPAPLGNALMLAELAGRLGARGAQAYCIDYRSDTWEHAAGDVEAAIADLRRLTSTPITLVSHSFGGIPALVTALRDGAVDAYVAVNSSVLVSYPGFPDALALAKLHPTLPVSVVRSTGDSTGSVGREEFVAALHAAGHPGLNIMGPGDHTGPLYTEATIDAILATARMIR